MWHLSEKQYEMMVIFGKWFTLLNSCIFSSVLCLISSVEQKKKNYNCQRWKTLLCITSLWDVTTSFLLCAHQLKARRRLCLWSAHGLHLRQAVGQTPTPASLLHYEISRARGSCTIKRWGIPPPLLACGSQSGTRETSGHWQDSDGLSYKHQIRLLAVMLLFVCQEFSKKGYVNLKRPSWLNKD